MARTRSAEREAFWRQLLESQAASDLSVAGFCARVGVSTASFYRWQRVLRRRDGKWRGKRQAATKSVSDDSLLPVRVVAEPSLPAQLEVTWPNGIQVRISRECDASQVGEVLRLVDQLAQRGALPC